MDRKRPQLRRRLGGIAIVAAALAGSVATGAEARDRIYLSAGFDCPISDASVVIRTCVRFIGRPEIDTHGTLSGVEVFVVEEELERKHNQPEYYRLRRETGIAGAQVRIEYLVEGYGQRATGHVCDIVTGADGTGVCEPIAIGDATNLYDVKRKVVSATYAGRDGAAGTRDDVFIRIIDDDRLDPEYLVEDLLAGIGPQHQDP